MGSTPIGCTNKWIKMRTIKCPECNEIIAVLDNINYVIHCNQIIYVPSERDANIFFNELNNPKGRAGAADKSSIRWAATPATQFQENAK